MHLFFVALCWITILLFGYHTATANALHNNHKWMRTEVMDGNGLYVLDWKVHGKEIIFRATVNTRGFIGLGFSKKTGKMINADLVLAWVDDRTGKAHIVVNNSKYIFYCLYLYTLYIHKVTHVLKNTSLGIS